MSFIMPALALTASQPSPPTQGASQTTRQRLCVCLTHTQILTHRYRYLVWLGVHISCALSYLF